MTALGAARLAAFGVGLIPDLEAHPAEAPARWTPRMTADERKRLLSGWRRAVSRVPEKADWASRVSVIHILRRPVFSGVVRCNNGGLHSPTPARKQSFALIRRPSRR